MAWGFWSASTVSDRGRSPRRATTTSSSAIYHQSQSQPQPQYSIAMNQCVKQEDTTNCQVISLPPPPQQQQLQNQQAKQGPSTCGSPCQSVCHSPTCQSPSCQSGTTGKFIIIYYNKF